MQGSQDISCFIVGVSFARASLRPVQNHFHSGNDSICKVAVCLGESCLQSTG